MEGYALSFLKAEWKVSNTGSTHWASSLIKFPFIPSSILDQKCTSQFAIVFPRRWNVVFFLKEIERTYYLYVIHLRIHWSELRYLDLHRRSASVNHVVTSVASAVSNCNTQVFHSKTTGKEYKIFCNVNCKTPNVVYLLDCHVCGSQYVGESVQPFNKRMNGHRSDLTKKTLLSVSQHFVSPGHSLEDFGRFKIYIIDHNPSWKENQRQKKESFWIRELQTLHPEGINKKA